MTGRVTSVSVVPKVVAIGVGFDEPEIRQVSAAPGFGPTAERISAVRRRLNRNAFFQAAAAERVAP